MCLYEVFHDFNIFTCWVGNLNSYIILKMRNFWTGAQAAVIPLSDFTQPDCLPLTISKLQLGITPMPIPLTPTHIHSPLSIPTLCQRSCSNQLGRIKTFIHRDEWYYSHSQDIKWANRRADKRFLMEERKPAGCFLIASRGSSGMKWLVVMQV